MERDRLEQFTRRVVRKARRESLKEGMRWALSLGVLLESLLFLCWRLSPFPFWIFFLPLLSLIWALFFPSRLKEEEAVLEFDRHLGLEERLLTAYELMKDKRSTSLSPFLLEDLSGRIQGIEPEKHRPSRSRGKAYFLLLFSLPFFLLSLFLPPLFSGNRAPPSSLLEPVLLQASSFQKERIYSLIEEAQKELGKGRKEEARALLEEAQKLTQDLQGRDEQALSLLSQDAELSFLAKGALDPGKLEDLSQLTLKEREALREKIESKLKELPPGAIREALSQLASQLPQGGNSLQQAVKNYSQVQEKESELSSLLKEALKEGGELASSPGGKQGEGQASPGEGIGTQGGLPGKEGGQDQPAYQKSSGTSPQEGQGLVYVPQELSASPGEELVLPEAGEGSYQVLSPQSSTEQGKVEDFRQVLPQFKERALEQSLERAYPPLEQDLILRYFQSLESQK